MLATRRTNTIGLVLSRIGGDYFAPLLRGIEAETAAAGMNLLISSGSPRSGASVAEHSTDGLLGFADSLDDAEIRQLWRREHPLVLLHRTPPDDLAIPCVTVENKAGARQLVDHLIEVHHASRIAFLRGPAGHEDSNWRELGYRESLVAHGLEPDPALVGDGNFSASVAEQQVASWLADGLTWTRSSPATTRPPSARCRRSRRPVGRAGSAWSGSTTCRWPSTSPPASRPSARRPSRSAGRP